MNKEDFEEGIVGSGEKMQQVLKKIGQVAASEATVMITGESGTGKNSLRCIHRHSHRSDGSFHAVNCGAIPENSIESELFGHEKELLLVPRPNLDNLKYATKELFSWTKLEIWDPYQTKILRAIQEGEIQRVGSTKVKSDVRPLPPLTRI